MQAKRTLAEKLQLGIDPLKGMLILIIVLDHSDEAHAFLPGTFRPLTFHVLGFLLLPFLVRGTSLSVGFLRDRLTRYWVPYAFTITLAAILFSLLHRRSDGAARIAFDYVAALLVGSAPLVKQSSGFVAYWFLPTLFGLVVVLGLYRRLSTLWRGVLVALFLVCHAFLNETSFPQYRW